MRIPQVLLALFGLVALPAALAQRDTAPLNAEQILKEVDQLEKKQKESGRAEKAQAIATLTRAADSSTAANNLYEDAIEQTQFNGRKEKNPGIPRMEKEKIWTCSIPGKWKQLCACTFGI